MVTLGLKLKSLKTCENDSTTLLKFFYGKRPLEKMLIFAKLQDFEKW